MQIEEDGQSAIVAYGTSYAGVVEGGSQAHEIMARNALTLAFIPSSFGSLAAAQTASESRRRTGAVSASRAAQDVTIFPTHVFHPGTLANPFMVRGWADAAEDVAAMIQQVGKHMIGDGDQTGAEGV